MSEFMAEDGCLLSDRGDGKVLATGPWHVWYAWRPIWTMHAGWVWLAKVERQFSKMSRPSGVTTVVVTYRSAQAAQSRKGGGP